MRKPYFRADRGAWFVKTAGGRSQIRLHEDEAEAYRIWQESLAAENPEDPHAPTAAIAEAFLAWAESRVAPKTYRGYSDFLASFCNEAGSIKARALKPFNVTRWLAGQATWGTETQRGAIAAVKRCFNWAVAEGLIDRNPLAGVKKPAASRREFLVSDEQHAAMIAAEDRGRESDRRAAVFRAVLIALKHSGQRPGMVASVRVEDVADDCSAWVMRQHKNRRKTGAPLVIYLSPCLQALTRAAIGSRTSGPLFTNSRGEPWTSNAIRCRMRELRRKLGLPAGAVAYAYRHTWITGALKNGVGLAATAELAGHSDLKMISRHYGHLDKEAEHLKAAAAKAVKRG